MLYIVYFKMIKGSIMYSSFFYIFSLIMFLFSNIPFIFWLLMEINLLFFVFMMFSMDLNKSLYQEESLFLYFIIQSFSSFMFLFSIYYKEFYKVYSELLFSLSICFKLGIFPFYFWMVTMACSMGHISFSILLSIQKAPLFLILFNSNIYFLSILIFSSFLVGSLLIFFSKNIKEMLIFSSISSSLIIFLLYMESIMIFVVFFLLYFMSLIQISFSSGDLSSNHLNKIILFMFLCGLPPFSLFFFKFYILSMFNFLYPYLMVLIFWIFSFISLLGYTKIFYSSFFFLKSPHLNNEFLFKKMSYLGLTSLNFLFFVFY